VVPGGAAVSCINCREAEAFHGWDDCLKCGVAVALVEDPDYINLARRLYADQREWLKQLEAEWARQASALLAAGNQVAA
jgi:hypothetical protein